MITDSELLRRYVESGDQEAFREVVGRHIHVIYATALRRTGGRAQLAEEVVQDVFSALAANAARLSGYSTLVGWLFVATRFAANKALRRERRRSRREQEVYRMQHDDRGGESVAQTWQQIRPAIDGLLDDLPERDRTAVLLRFFENRSFAELGDMFGISEDAARMRVERTLAKLAAGLKRRGIGSTSSLLASALATQAAVTAPAALVSSVSLAAASGAVTATGVSSLYFLTVMSTTKTILAGAVAAIVLVGALGVYQVNRRQSAETALAAASEQMQATATKLRDSEQAMGALKRENGELKAAIASQAARPAPVPAPAVKAQGASEGSLRDSDLVILRLKFAAQPLFARWGIGPEAQDEILRLAGEPARIKQDAVELAKAELRKGTWSRENDVKLGETTQRAIQETMQKLDALLGPERVLELAKLGASLGERELASRIAGDVAFTDAPLNQSSAESLVQILQQTRYTPRNYQSTPVGGATITAEAAKAAKPWLNEQGLGTLPLVTDATLAKANEVLAPLQMAALRRLQAQQLASIKMAQEANAGGGR